MRSRSIRMGLVLVAAASGLLTAGSARAESVRVDLVGQWGGYSYAVAVAGNLVYLGVGPRLVVLDVSDPQSPVVLGKTGVLPDAVYDVAVAGDYAYVVHKGVGLYVINIADPTAPEWVGGYDTSGYGTDAVTVVGDLAYLGVASRLLVLDVSDPPRPVVLGQSDRLPGNIVDVTVAGDYAYLAVSQAGLQIINIANPAAPEWVGAYDTEGSTYCVAVAGDYAYVGDFGDCGGFLWVINIADPAAPHYAAWYPAANDHVRAVVVAGDYAYLATGKWGLDVINIADRTDPQRAGGRQYIGGWTQNVAVADGFVYAVGPSGLRVYDVTDSPYGVLVSKYETSGQTHDVAVAGDYAYLVDDDYGLHVTSIADVTDPQRVAGYPEWDVNAVAVVGDYAYIVNNDDGLHVINIADPTAPRWVDVCYTGLGWAEDVAIVGDYAYVVIFTGKFQVINIADPTAVYRVATLDTSGYTRAVAAAEDYAYARVSSVGTGLEVINVADPTAPQLVSIYEEGRGSSGFAVVGDYAYMSGSTGFQVVDVSDPAALRQVGDCLVLGGTADVAVAGDYAYIAASSAGLQVVNIVDPVAPRWVGGCDTNGSAKSVAVAGDYVYVADYDCGLAVLHISLYGDMDGDWKVDLADHKLWVDCLDGPGVAYPDGCDAAALDRDLDVDLADFAELQTFFTGDE